MSQCQVSFNPQGRRVSVPKGISIVEAAARAGVLIETPCGGQGRCGRCLVRVEEGSITARESSRLTPEQQEQGWVLACTAKIAGDAIIFVPPKKERDRLAIEAAASSKVALAVECHFPFLPAVRQIYLEIPPPSLEDNTPDLERVREALSREYNIDRFDLDLPLLQALPGVLRQEGWKTTLVFDLAPPRPRLLKIHPGKRASRLLGIAVDLGTTNIALALVDLNSRKILERSSIRNKQSVRGEDVISRIIYTEKQKDGLKELQSLAVKAINELIREVCQRSGADPHDILDMVVAGNTTMTHLFLGILPSYIRQEPYVPAVSTFPLMRAADLGIEINPQASVYCMPAVAAYVGGDITAGVLASCLFRAEKLTLFLDIGTNGEIVLGTSEWLTTCACSAGPAFEGAGATWGMRAVTGAIEEVRINSKTLEPFLKVIGDVPPQGICGSGMITALSEMFLTGVIDKSGRLNIDFVVSKNPERPRARIGDHGPEYVLAWAEETGVDSDIVLTETDINNLIRTKAAIYAGISIMLKSLGISPHQVEEVLIGGAFGQHINIAEAIYIGLFPDLPWDRFKFLGNTSLAGAYNALVSRAARELAEEVSRKMTYFELIADPTFMDEFSAALFLPHTDLDLFPSAKAALEAASKGS